MRWVPRFTYGATVVALRWPMRVWVKGQRVEGGRDRTADGTDAAWRTERARRVTISVRVDETDWPALRAFIRYAQSGATVTWEPDALAPETPYLESVDVQLESPRIEEPLAPVPDPDYPRVLSIDLAFLRSDNVPWHVPYFGE